MADWFKLHENWFHEPRFQWAIKEQATVLQVWLWALTECCRTKSDTIGLHCEDYEMLGIQQLLNLSPGLFNHGLGLLEKIKYIEVNNSKKTIKVLKWNDFQSDYLKKKGCIKSDTVRQSPIKSDSVPLEERRGEEKRREKKAAPRPEDFEVPETLRGHVGFTEEFSRWIECRSRFQKPKPGWVAFFQEQLDFLAKFGGPAAVWAMEQSRVNGWQGIFPEKFRPPPGSRPSAPATLRPSPLAEPQEAV